MNQNSELKGAKKLVTKSDLFHITYSHGPINTRWWCVVMLFLKITIFLQGYIALFFLDLIMRICHSAIQKIVTVFVLGHHM